MAFVNDLTIEDNSTPASATAQITAQRIGNALQKRYQDFIHKRECSPSQSDYDIKMASRSLAAFTVFQLARVDDQEAGSCVCDSTNDGGIDAICVNHNEKIVVVVQAKFNQAGNGTWSNNDFLNFKNACDKLQQEEYTRFDEILREKQADINLALSSFDYKFLFVMTHTGKRGAAENILLDMQEWQRELNDASLIASDMPNDELPFQVHLVSAEDMQQWLLSGSRNNIDLDDVEIEKYGQIDEPYQALYGLISGDQIAEWWRIYGPRLFTKNIRNLLGKTDVNEAIKETASQNPELFWYYNNGITLLINGVEPHRRNASRGSERGNFRFTDISIINGAQTVSSIGMLADSIGEDLSKIKVSARFIKPNGNDEIANSITKSNNYQNRVLGRDFASQRPEHHRLSKEIVIEGYQYQLLRSGPDNTSNDPLVIDLDEALNGLACLTKNPTILATLKSQRGKFFDNFDGTLYRSVFNSNVSGVKLINSVIHNRVIEKLMSEMLHLTDRYTASKRYLIITHANRVFSSIVLNSINNISNAREILSPNEARLREELTQAVQLTESYIEEFHSTAYPARFFANTRKISDLFSYLEKNITTQ